MLLNLSAYTTPDKAAKLAGLTARRILQLCDAGEIEHVRMSPRSVLVLKAAARARKKKKKKS